MIKIGDKIGDFECTGIRKVIWNNKLKCFVDSPPNEKNYDFQLRFQILHPEFGRAIILLLITKELIEDTFVDIYQEMIVHRLIFEYNLLIAGK